MDFTEKLSLLPDKPGCYQMKNSDGIVIYVGKAKNLKKRVKSYFTGSNNTKTQKLVSNIADFDYIITNSELEALLLELNLIKKYDPRYNIMLTDDKTYPYILLTNERHPRLLVTRKITKKSGKFYGPYPNASSARETVKMLNMVYPLRKCRRLPDKECLYYHMHQCLGPCIQKVNEEEYSKIKAEINEFLNGNVKQVIKGLQDKMYLCSENLEFERAKEYKELIEHITKTTEKQKINLSDLKDRDVFGYYYDENHLCIDTFYIRMGKIVARDYSLSEYYGDPLDKVAHYILNFYQNKPLPKELFIPTDINSELLQDALGVKITSPKIGDKKKMVDMANANAKETLISKRELQILKQERTIGAIEKLGEILNIPTPYRIEAFDNSNIQGTNAVSAMVVFTNGVPNKKSYRKYKIKSVEGADDYKSMKEVIYRRYHRMLMEDLKKPDLIVIDGGKGQLSAATSIIESLGLSIPIVSLKKDDKHGTDTVIMNNKEFKLNKRSNEFHLLTRIQDEVHRFAITFHKDLRNKGVYHSILDSINGLGPKRKRRLLMEFGSVENIKNKSIEEITKLGISERIAKNILEELSRNN